MVPDEFPHYPRLFFPFDEGRIALRVVRALGTRFRGASELFELFEVQIKSSLVSRRLVPTLRVKRRFALYGQSAYRNLMLLEIEFQNLKTKFTLVRFHTSYIWQMEITSTIENCDLSAMYTKEWRKKIRFACDTWSIECARNIYA